MTQEELEALLAQIAPNGQTNRLEHTQEVVTRKVKRKVPSGSEFKPDTEEDVEVKVPVHTWIDRGTGRKLVVEVGADGAYTPTFNGIDPKVQGEPATGAETPASRRVSREEAEIARNAALPKDQDPRAETDAQRAARADATIKEQGTAARQATLDAEAKAERDRVAARQAQADAVAAAEKNRPTTTIKDDGKGGLVSIQTFPDGRPPVTTPIPGVQGKPDQVTVQGTVYERGPDGTYKPASGLPQAGVGNIKGLPTYTPDLTKPGAGLIDYAKQLDEFMAANPSFTWEKRQEVLKNAQTLAAQVAGEFNTGAAVLREQYQNETSQRGQDISQAGNRANLANSHHQNAVALIEKFAPYLGATPGDAGKLFMGMMASHLATATAYGGMKETPRVQMDPRLTAFADRTVGAATATPGSAPGGPVGTGAPAPPNALGLGAIGNQPAPVGAPVLPGAEVGTQAVPGGIAPPAAPPVRDDWRLGGPPPPVNPMPGQPGSDPNTPISQVNPAVESLLGNVLPPQPTSWREDAQARASMFEPMNPGNVALGERMLGSALPTQPYGGGFSLGGPVGPAPLALQSAVPGLTPEIDAEARRQLQAELQGVA